MMATHFLIVNKLSRRTVRLVVEGRGSTGLFNRERRGSNRMSSLCLILVQFRELSRDPVTRGEGKVGEEGESRKTSLAPSCYDTALDL